MQRESILSLSELRVHNFIPKIFLYFAETEEDDITTHVSHQLSSTFNIEALLSSAEFDNLLSSIERDLDEKSSLDADSKEGEYFHLCSLFWTEEVSELGDVLLYLSKVAEEKKTKPTNHDPKFVQAPSLSNEVSNLDPPFSLTDSTAKAPGKTPLPTPPQSNLQQLPPPPPHRHEQIKPAESVRSGGYGRGRGRGSGNQRTSVEDNDGSDSNSDDDDNWRKTRNRIKSTKEGLQEELDRHQSNHSFWNAYGVSTTTLTTVSVTNNSELPLDKVDDDSPTSESGYCSCIDLLNTCRF